jgi:hypothetical protein
MKNHLLLERYGKWERGGDTHNAPYERHPQLKLKLKLFTTIAELTAVILGRPRDRAS